MVNINVQIKWCSCLTNPSPLNDQFWTNSTSNNRRSVFSVIRSSYLTNPGPLNDQSQFQTNYIERQTIGIFFIRRMLFEKFMSALNDEPQFQLNTIYHQTIFNSTDDKGPVKKYDLVKFQRDWLVFDSTSNWPRDCDCSIDRCLHATINKPLCNTQRRLGT